MFRILIVDDEPIIRQSLTGRVEELSKLIVVAGTAATGLEALEWLSGHYADICITDVRMPEMDGLELIGRMNEAFPWMETIIISSYDDFSYAKRGLQLGALDYLLKPIDEEQLQDTMQKAIQRIGQERHNQAADLLITKLPHYKSMLDRWVNQLQTVQFETMPLLVVDTLEMLEEWVGGRYYLLNPLAMAWLQMIVETVKSEKVDLTLEEGEDLGLGEKTIPLSKQRSYFRLCAVRRLEEGAHRLFDAMKGLQDHSTRKVIEQMKKYVQSRFNEKLSLQEVADHVAMSRSYIVNLFKQETGMTIWNYLVSVRMQRARELLLGTNLKSYEIAQRVGYENGMHFSQIFKEHYGLSPMEYKKRMET